MARPPRLQAAMDAAGIEGCGDSSCMFGSPPGQHTNGGCRCLPRYGGPPTTDDWHKVKQLVHRMALAMRRLAEEPS
jgi:hypothetical protein